MENFTLYTREHDSTEFNLICISHTGYSFTNNDYEEVSVPGRDTPFIRNNHTKPRVEIQVEAFLDSEELFETAALIKRWLTNDVTDQPIIISNMGDYYLKGFLNNKLNIEEVIRQTGRITFEFNCQPFLYHVDGEFPISMILNNSVTQSYIINPCTEGKPLIKIVCSGDVVKFSIGTQSVELRNVNGTYYIDSDKMEMYMYDASNNIVLQNSKMYSDFPTLGAGKHILTINQGTVSNFTITPRWRV